MTAMRKDKDTPEFSDVYITETRAFFANDFDPTFEENLAALELRTLAFVDRSQALVSKADGTGRFRVYFNFGAKWSKPEDEDSSATPDSSQLDEQPPEPEGLITIECGIVAEFTLSRRYEQADLDDFALSNAVDFITPYWKNYLITQCGLMRLQQLVLPDGNHSTDP